MEYHNVTKLLENTRNQLSKLKRKNQVEINVEEVGTLMLKSSLCTQNYAHILLKRTITGVGHDIDVAAIAANRNDKEVVFKNCTRFTDQIIEIISTQVGIAKYFDIVMLMYDLIKSGDNYSKIT